MTHIKIALLPILLSVGLYAVQSPRPLEGKYICSGIDAHGVAYQTNLEIEVVKGGYGLQWGDDRPARIFGFGIIHTDILASWIVDGVNGAVGVVAYTMRPGRLEGTWTAGDGQTHPEVCSGAGLSV